MPKLGDAMTLSVRATLVHGPDGGAGIGATSANTDVDIEDDGVFVGSVRPVVGGGIQIVIGRHTWLIDAIELWESANIADANRMLDPNMSDEDLDAELRAMGEDPEAIAARGADLVRELERSKLAERRRKL